MRLRRNGRSTVICCVIAIQYRPLFTIIWGPGLNFLIHVLAVAHVSLIVLPLPVTAHDSINKSIPTQLPRI